MPTDFSRFTPLQQAQMLAAGDPAAVRACGDLWSDVAGSLYSRVGDMEQQLREFSPYWTGAAADQYQRMIRDLIDGVRQTADVARIIADNVYRAGEALAAAKRHLPHQALPELARIYADLEAAIPPLPRVAGAPSASDVLTGRYRPDPALLFSGVYGNGLASAAAALGGHFSSAVPHIVGPVGAAVPSPGVAASGMGFVAPESPSPVSSGIGRATIEPVSFTGSAAVPEQAVTPPPAAGGNPSPAGGSFFPPVMPFGGAGAAGGGDGFGNDRAVPVWLTEPEPEVVFGVALPAVMSVIGEEPSAPAPPAGQWGF